MVERIDLASLGQPKRHGADVNTAFTEALRFMTRGMSIGQRTRWEGIVEPVREGAVNGITTIAGERGKTLTLTLGDPRMAKKFSEGLKKNLPGDLGHLTITTSRGKVIISNPPSQPKSVLVDFETP
ncbi:MAG TPA: hypothetical protein VJH24_04625 [Candidatus Bilamarchaeaceae archaeon]|nr:hypothetical protein [Candidatus Bilamarchaeaceae archaeon]